MDLILQMKKAKNEEERVMYKKRALDYLERYMYLILFNTYLHCERRNKWKVTFSAWMKEVRTLCVYYFIYWQIMRQFERSALLLPNVLIYTKYSYS